MKIEIESVEKPCPECNYPHIDHNWGYCPECGYNLKQFSSEDADDGEFEKDGVNEKQSD